MSELVAKGEKPTEKIEAVVEEKEEVVEKTEVIVDGASKVAAGGEKEVGDDAELSALTAALKLNHETVTPFEETHLFIGEGVTFRHENFSDVPEPILEAIEKDLELKIPSPIQYHVMPQASKGRSVIAQAQTGSGKTLAFAVALLSMIDPTKDELQAVVVAPTRELIQQIANEAINNLAQRMDPKPSIKMAIKGEPTPKRGSKCKSQICCGTPGKIMDWASSGFLNFKKLRVFVLDEADEMINSFRSDIASFAEKLPKECQMLFFSATYPSECEAYCDRLAPTALKVKVPKNNLMIGQICQIRMSVPKGGKVQVLKNAYDILGVESSIVFLKTVKEAEEVSKMMLDAGFTVSTLHGKIEGTDRDAVMDQFRKGDTKFLITTDVLARGVDVPAVSVVVNYTIPKSKEHRHAPELPDAEMYLHRIGRTGRYNRRGFAITFTEDEQDERDLEGIEAEYSPPGERITIPCSSTSESILELKEYISKKKTVTRG